MLKRTKSCMFWLFFTRGVWCGDVYWLFFYEMWQLVNRGLIEGVQSRQRRVPRSDQYCADEGVSWEEAGFVAIWGP